MPSSPRARFINPCQAVTFLAAGVVTFAPRRATRALLYSAFEAERQPPFDVPRDLA